MQTTAKSGQMLHTGGRAKRTCRDHKEAGGGVDEDEGVHGAQGDLHSARLLPPVAPAAGLHSLLQGRVLLQQVHLSTAAHTLTPSALSHCKSGHVLNSVIFLVKILLPN